MKEIIAKFCLILIFIISSSCGYKVLDNKGSEDFNITEIKTSGDIHHSKKLSEIGGKGLFSKQIEKELLNQNIDIAVHALKDLPSYETKGLETKVFLKRNDPRDVFINLQNKSISDLKSNSIVGTSSFRRAAQLNVLRKDMIVKMMRGNVDTRINKLKQQQFDAIVLSYAGVEIMGLKNQISQIFSIDEMLPCVGQGVIALQCRKDDSSLIDILKNVNHQLTYNCISIFTNYGICKVRYKTSFFYFRR